MLGGTLPGKNPRSKRSSRKLSCCRGMPPTSSTGPSAAELMRRAFGPSRIRSIGCRSRSGPCTSCAAREGDFREPGVDPASVRFWERRYPKVNSDFKPDVRALSFSVDLTRDGTAARGATVGRQDFSLQNTKTLRINDATAFLATMKRLTASNPAVGLWSLRQCTVCTDGNRRVPGKARGDCGTSSP